MVDFLKANPSFNREDYLWNLTIPQIVIMSNDASHLLDEESEGDDSNVKQKSGVLYDIPVL